MKIRYVIIRYVYLRKQILTGALMFNPFRVGQKVTGEFFTDRAEEVSRVVRALRDPSRLLVYGPRRMGKSSVIAMAAERVRADGGLVVEADLSTASVLSDVTGRLLTSLHRAGDGEGGGAGVLDLFRNLRLRFEVDPGTGAPSVTLEARERSTPPERQAETLEGVLDRLDGLAADADHPVAVVLDEFQDVVRIGPERAAWWLRSVMQRHERLSYVCAGSRQSIVAQMISKEGAFYGGFERLHLGPVDPEHLARWIDSRLEGAGVDPGGCGEDGVGAEVVGAVGPRLQDVMMLARQTYYVGASRGQLEEGDVERALDELVQGDDAVFQALWDRLTPLQQNVLRAVADGETSLHASAVRERWALGPASSVATALQSLTKQEVLVDADEVRFDSPFFRRWVRTRTGV